ncbi:MAG: cyclodeaminase/cyclohydrolase family protein [Candidatus Omnitrophica bacterium]|nr:cyclodeaminase/cyclohydrolase family protein [Candidatus Omnitrophota bacterium]MDD5310719.1 cyclodeaminase/cyclohydrolase family protein [Candidatus Omnitrophota bacterium]MDD5545597.1 cyclodeaminase/cyclohydrolase family protein [Candidatus Omnitrophota bacterium]
MKISAKNRIDLFVKELGERKPSPGGGAGAALTGALGAALIIKVANFTIGKKKYKRYDNEARSMAKKAEALRNKLGACIERDARRYNEYARTRSKASMQKASDCAAEISKLSGQGVKICMRLKKIGNKNLKGDITAAELFLRAAAKASGNLIKQKKKRWIVR